MQSTPSSVAPAPNDPSDRPENHGCCSDAAIEARTAQQLAALAILTRIGLKVAGMVERRVDATEPPKPDEPPVADPEPPDDQAVADLVVAYSRIARAVRANLTLENKITQAHRNRAAREPAERDGRHALDEPTRRARLRKKVERILDEAIEQNFDPEDQEDLRSNLEDCLDEFDDDPDFTSRSVGEIVASLCTDLSLDPDWHMWQYELWGAKEIRTRPPGSPYANWPPEPDDEPNAGGHDPPDAVS